MESVDGDYRIRYRDSRRRRTVYVKVANGCIVSTQPPMPLWNNRPFVDACKRLRKRYPKTFEQQEWSEQLVTPLPPRDDHDVQGEAVYMPTPLEIAEHAAKIRKGWATEHHNDDEPSPYERPTVSTDAIAVTERPAGGPLYPMDE